MQLILVNNTAAEVISPTFVNDGRRLIGLKCTGVAGAEVVALEVQVGAAFVPVLDSAGAAVTFTSTNIPINISGSGIYRINKPSTVGAVTIQAN